MKKYSTPIIILLVFLSTFYLTNCERVKKGIQGPQGFIFEDSIGARAHLIELQVNTADPNKLDSTKDAYIIFSALDHFSKNETNFIFVSANKNDFGSKENIETEIHPEIVEDYNEITINYFNDIGRMIHELKNELPHKSESSKTNHSAEEIHREEILIDGNKPILDQIYEYVINRQSELSFVPIHIFKNHSIFKQNPNHFSYYSLFSLSTDNKELIDFFNAVEISENNIIITNPAFYKGVKDYQNKIKAVLSRLTNNLIFNLTDSNNRNRIDIRLSKKELCDCPKCSYRKLRFKHSFDTINTYTDSNKDLLESAYVNYLIGNYISAAEILLRAVKVFNQSKLYTLEFIARYNLVRLRQYLRNNHSGSSSSNNLVDEIKQINLEQEAIRLSDKKNKSIIDFIRQHDFYNSARDKIQESTSKIIDQYYNQLKGDWSSNSEVWKLINEYAQLVSFLQDNYIIYEEFREFKDVFAIFLEGIIASHSITSPHSSSLEFIDDWVFKQIIMFGDAKSINKLYNRYGRRKLQYSKTSSHGESFLELIDNYFSIDGIEKSFQDNCENNNRQFWNHFNSVFTNILTLVSICDFDSKFHNSFMQKVLTFFELESHIRHQNRLYVDHYLRRCSEHLNNDILQNLFQLGFENSIFQENDYFETLVDISTKRKVRFDITETQFTLLNDISDYTTLVHIWLLISNIDYKNRIVKIIHEKLENQFNFSLFYMAALYEVIELEKGLLQTAINDAIPKQNHGSFEKAFFGVKENRFNKVDQLLNLCFKSEIETNTNQFSPFKALDDYYEWLIDMDGFNYRKFKREWIGKYPTKFYFRRMYNCKKVRRKLNGILKKDFNSGLEKDYVNIYIRKTWDYNT